MGWFDEDDDDDSEEEKANKRPSLMSAEDIQNGSGNQQDHEEEDPLDAYMKSLGDKPSNNDTNPSGRMDLDNEEEATRHWETAESTKLDNTAIDNKDDDVDEDGFIKCSAIAKRKLEQTFHKAGARRPQEDDDNDSDDVKKTRSKAVDIQLEQVDHDRMKYHRFEKVFWNPQPNTTTTANESHQSWRHQHGITIQPPQYQNQFPPIYDFLELKDEVMEDILLEHIRKSGYHHPTPVQAQTLPVALGGHDALITAPTGSGKTLAYVWPMVVHVCAQHLLEPNETGPIGLILVPTRELAQQVEKHVQKTIKVMNGSSLTIIGGMGKYPLVQQLKQKGGVEIVVATPGRLLDVLATKQQQDDSNSKSQKYKGLSLERTTMVVLDECDRLLHMGFANQVTQILSNIRPDRQTLMLSATMSRRIETVAQQWLASGGKGGIGHATNDYVRIAVGRTGQSSLHVQQHVMVLPDDAAKLSWLQQMLPVLCQVGRTLVFSATKDGCEQLANQLQLGEDTACVTLHGDKHQIDRTAALRKFVKQTKAVLIATDVASRGLDIPQVTTVINYDPPKNLDVHVHRVGRAGRLSANKNGEDDEQQPKEGTAYTLLRTPKDADIGHVLLGAFEREDRSVPEALRELAKLSRQQRGGNGSNAPSNQSRSRGNKSGLGASGNYYGSGSYSTQQSPVHKKGRWS